ncbi:MAG: hypothetical protein AAFQ94_18080 [Bacteroidota bacterium]
MADIKCVITYPDQMITHIGEFEINGLDAVEKIISPGTLHVTRKNVSVAVIIRVVGMIYGPKNLTCEMNVFADNVKVNSEPIKGKYKKNSGGYLFNYSNL